MMLDVAIEADRETLAAVVGNLLQNAFKYTRPGSEVSLRAHAGEFDFLSAAGQRVDLGEARAVDRSVPHPLSPISRRPARA